MSGEPARAEAADEPADALVVVSAWRSDWRTPTNIGVADLRSDAIAVA
jgi:hypothetical protein